MDPTAAGPNGPHNDTDLVARCVRGDAEAFQALAARYYRPVGGFLYKRVQHADVVEDLVQETFLEAFRSLRAGRRPEHFASWLFAVAQHCCGKWLRRRRPVLFATGEPPEEAVALSPDTAREELEEQEKLLAALDAGLAALPEEARRLLEMKHREGKTCAEIAGTLGRPVGTVKSLLSRTYKTLRERLRGSGGGP
jgi:RNA polymerase sigma-70 factor (ECF subfamily)